MYRIAILADQTKNGQHYARRIARFCAEKGIFPQFFLYQNQEQFFDRFEETAPTSAVISLPGVEGLNVIEHLYSLRRDCKVIWCSDLDFALHAFRLRVTYFILEPSTEELFQQGLTALFEKTMRLTASKEAASTKFQNITG